MVRLASMGGAGHFCRVGLSGVARLVIGVVGVLSVAGTADAAGGTSLRFFGSGTGDIDRVKIALDAPARPADVGGDFTLEFWMLALPGANTAPACVAGAIGRDGWLSGNILFDRDVFGAGDSGEYGLSLRSGRVAFGVAVGGVGETLCGGIDVADGVWHHVAATRSVTGGLAIYVDGTLDVSGTGPAGDLSYRDGRATGFPNSDPYLVIGAEKHDSGGLSYSGLIDEVRISTVVRYTTAFTRPVLPFVSDSRTAALYHFDEASGARVFDTSGAGGGPSNGERKVGGSLGGALWDAETPPLDHATTLTIVPLATGLATPQVIAHARDGSGRLFIAEAAGRIRIWTGSQLLATPFLDISDRVTAQSGRSGLAGLAFHPEYATNGYFYVFYSRTEDPSTVEIELGDIVVARYRVSSDPNLADVASGSTVLSIHADFISNYGGGLAFGSDGYLYITIGDGQLRGLGDPLEVGQDLESLLGKLLRIDVDSASPYAIPPDNPFVGRPGRDEIWAYGLQFPWHFSVDRLTGDLFLGDTGDLYQEINHQPAASTGGENYGWDVLEGTTCHEDDPPGSCLAFLAGSTLPIIEPPQLIRGGIIGGHVFRGKPFGTSWGHYYFGDFFAGELYRAAPHLGAGPWPFAWVNGVLGYRSMDGFGEDERGSLYFVTGFGVFPGDNQGALYQVAMHTFTDILPPHFAWYFVESIFAARITAGCGGGLYCPESPATREQMAIFLLRGKEDQTYLPPVCTTPSFTDVPCDSIYARWIEELRRRNITAGCGPGLYCPADPVTREQMAIFLLRSIEGPSYNPPACTTPTFADVPCSSGYAAWIGELARRGITAGCGGGNYCPTSSVTRGQMAVFLVRAFNIP